MRATMWNNLRKPLFALSLGLNLAFIAMWLIHSLPVPGGGEDISRSVDDGAAVPSALHREIGVKEEQWKQIAPLVQAFREKAGKQRRKIRAFRGQLMDLLTMPGVDKAAIRLKQDEILLNQRQMQNLVIDHLLKEKEILSPEQAKKLMQYLRRQCRQDSGMGSGKGIGRVLDEK
mgnify:CR=1 FL=1